MCLACEYVSVSCKSALCTGEAAARLERLENGALGEQVHVGPRDARPDRVQHGAVGGEHCLVNEALAVGEATAHRVAHGDVRRVAVVLAAHVEQPTNSIHLHHIHQALLFSYCMHTTGKEGGGDGTKSVMGYTYTVSPSFMSRSFGRPACP